MSFEQINFPCMECENDVLLILPDYKSTVECSECGHPNEAPSQEQIDVYRIRSES